jgi:hypothetical protein
VPASKPYEKKYFPILQQYVYNILHCNIISYNYIPLLGANKTSLTLPLFIVVLDIFHTRDTFMSIPKGKLCI